MPGEAAEAQALPYEEVIGADDREAWLEARQTGIGASEISAVLGANPFKSATELYLEKTGAVAAPDLSDNDAVYWGNVHEQNIVAAFEGRYAHIPVTRAQALLRSRAHPWALATLDAWADDPKHGRIPLEVKSTQQVNGHLWRDGVPEWFRAQVHQQMLVTGTEMAIVAVLIGSSEYAWDYVELDETLARKIIYHGERFWGHVLSRTPPPVDGSEATRRAIHAAHPLDDGQSLVLGADFADVDAELVDLKSQRKAIETEIRQRENQIKAALGDAVEGVIPGVAAYRWTTEERAAYAVAASTRRTLRRRAPKED
jgi:putative phage-type endonuclease